MIGTIRNTVRNTVINTVKLGANVIPFDELAPSSLLLTVLSASSIKLDWTVNSANADGTKVERSTDGVSFTEVGSVVGATFTDTGLTDGVKYYYRVRNYKGTGYSTYSSIANDYTYTSEIQLHISELDTPLSSGQINKLNKLVRDLKEGLEISNLSDFFDILYVRANETVESSLKNIVKDSHHSTAVNSPTHIPLEGFTGQRTASYIDTNYNAYSQKVNFALDDCSIFTYSRTENNTNGAEFGCVAGSMFSVLFKVTGSTTTAYRLNTFINDGSISVPYVTTLGLTILTRNSVGNLTSYRNNTKNTASVVSSEIINLNFYELCRNKDNAPEAFIDRQISISGAGKGVSDAQALVITNAFEAYMDSNGKGVIT